MMSMKPVGQWRSYCSMLLTSVSGLVLFSLGSLAFGEQLGQPSDAALLKALAPELVNPAIVTKPEDLSPERQSVLTEPGLGFRFEGDFNADGRRDLVLLGQHGQDRRRSFVLIATAQGGGWARSGLLTFEAEFVVAKKVENGRVWIFFCANCDYGGSLEWTGSQYVLQPFSFSVVAALGTASQSPRTVTGSAAPLRSAAYKSVWFPAGTPDSWGPFQLLRERSFLLDKTRVDVAATRKDAAFAQQP
jgi:hypothetical protein